MQRPPGLGLGPFVLLTLAACGADPVAGAGDASSAASATTSDTSAAPPEGSSEPVGTTSVPDPTTGAAATTGTTSTATTADPDATTAPATTTGDLTTTTTTTGDTTGAPEPDPCAKQDKAPPAVDPPGALNDDPAFIHVYINNIENLKTAGEQCAGDWTDLIYAIKVVDPSPDLFLVQQVSDTAQLDVLLDRMNKELPGVFVGVIADADPWTQLSPCGPEKAKQTNAVIYREGRFSQVGDKHVWQSWANKGGECVRNNQARTRNVMVKLHDKIADRDISVASMHWSTSAGDGPDPACAEKNVLEVDEKLHKAGYGGDLLIFGGDFNEPDRKDNGDPRPWFAAANGDGKGPLNYRDPIYRACQSADDLQQCLENNWTAVGSLNRIDILFAQDGAGCRARTRRAHTITFDEADDAAEQVTGIPDEPANYSDHRAVRAEIYYPD